MFLISFYANERNQGSKFSVRVINVYRGIDHFDNELPFSVEDVKLSLQLTTKCAFCLSTKLYKNECAVILFTTLICN